MTPRCLCLLRRRYLVTTIELTQRRTPYARDNKLASTWACISPLIKVVLVLALRVPRSGAVTDSHQPATRHRACGQPQKSKRASQRALFCHVYKPLMLLAHHTELWINHPSVSSVV